MSASCSKRVNKGSWSSGEDEKLLKLIAEARQNQMIAKAKLAEASGVSVEERFDCNGSGGSGSRGGNLPWSEIAKHLEMRTAKQCRERYVYSLQPGITKNPWTKNEDAIMIQLQKALGNCWSKIATHLPGRTENSVKSRFKSVMRAHRRSWKEHEDEALLELESTMGSKWAEIAAKIPGRSVNSVKHRFKILMGEAEEEPILPGGPEQALKLSAQEKEYYSRLVAGFLASSSSKGANPKPHTATGNLGGASSQIGRDEQHQQQRQGLRLQKKRSSSAKPSREMETPKGTETIPQFSFRKGSFCTAPATDEDANASTASAQPGADSPEAKLHTQTMISPKSASKVLLEKQHFQALGAMEPTSLPSSACGSVSSSSSSSAIRSLDSFKLTPSHSPIPISDDAGSSNSVISVKRSFADAEIPSTSHTPEMPDTMAFDISKVFDNEHAKLKQLKGFRCSSDATFDSKRPKWDSGQDSSMGIANLFSPFVIGPNSERTCTADSLKRYPPTSEAQPFFPLMFSRNHQFACDPKEFHHRLPGSELAADDLLFASADFL